MKDEELMKSIVDHSHRRDALELLKERTEEKYTGLKGSPVQYKRAILKQERRPLKMIELRKIKPPFSEKKINSADFQRKLREVQTKGIKVDLNKLGTMQESPYSEAYIYDLYLKAKMEKENNRRENARRVEINKQFDEENVNIKAANARERKAEEVRKDKAVKKRKAELGYYEADLKAIDAELKRENSILQKLYNEGHIDEMFRDKTTILSGLYNLVYTRRALSIGEAHRLFDENTWRANVLSEMKGIRTANEITSKYMSTLSDEIRAIESQLRELVDFHVEREQDLQGLVASSREEIAELRSAVNDIKNRPVSSDPAFNKQLNEYAKRKMNYEMYGQPSIGSPIWK